MKRLHWMILRMLPGPFLGWLGTLMFLFVMQFLIHHLPDIAGKGLPVGAVVELISYSLAYMVVLAVPMAVLLATLMTFGQLAESNTYAAIKGAGVSFFQMAWPVLVAGLLVSGGMTYFNNIVLPEANFRAKNLWRDIRVKKPGFELQPGVFYNGLNGYSILVQAAPPDSNVLRDVTIYDYTEGTRRTAVIKAERGYLEARRGGEALELTLADGELHRMENRSTGPGKRYERVRFDRHTMRLDLSDFAFERGNLNEGYRSDRTTPTPAMIAYVDSLRAEVAAGHDTLQQHVHEALAITPAPPPEDTQPPEEDAERMPEPAREAALASTSGDPSGAAAAPARRALLGGLSVAQQRRAYADAMADARVVRSHVSDASRDLVWKADRANRYQVEIYKKFSIAVACLLFVLIGAPLGVSIRRGGLGTVGALALGIFLFYWVTLVQGEKLADRGHLTPLVSMWMANVLGLAAGAWLFVHVTLDLRATPPLRTRLWRWIRSWIRPASSGEAAACQRPERSEEVPLGCAPTGVETDVRDGKIQNPKSAV